MTHTPLEPLEQPQALYKSVQDAVRDYILQNKLKPGDPLPSETKLTKLLGVSRNSVREAIKALQLVGLIESRRGSGIFVGEFSLMPLLENLPFSLVDDVHHFFDLIEIRRILEMGMIESAISSMDEDQLARLEAVLEDMHARASRGEKFPDEDRRFHQTLYENVNNPTFINLLDIFWLTFQRLAKFVDVESHSPMEIYEKHAAIMDAVKRGDVPAARSCLADHYEFKLRQ